ncbi:MAG TPA: hypothetical protein VEL07_07915 [Planctomycetota bacterium]|nr:hypothetical protein [Planctomycetota bacterium]
MADAVTATPDSARPDPSAKTAEAQAAGKAAAETTAGEWKPEPRQWSWKDLFTAPMLAFKPKCMLVSAATMLAIGLWNKLGVTIGGKLGDVPLLAEVVGWLWITVALVIFSLGATLVAVFMKADLLDDEFLSFKEAIGQYKNRLLPAIMVPVFLMGLLGGFYVLIAIPELIGSIPLVGPAIYALLYPLGFLLGLFITLLACAVLLSLFVFPAIVAIRKHGWFDNVVDTFEAVGTKPHILVGSLVLIWILISISNAIAFGGMDRLTEVARRMPGTGLIQTEAQARHVRETSFGWAGSVIPPVLPASLRGLAAQPATVNAVEPTTITGWHKVTGTITGIWQILIGALIFGYCLNLFVGGGMLTYLVVREDDYWDDEDLEDLDQLAKELEEEAKQDAAKVSAAAPAAATPAPVVAASTAPATTPPEAAPPAATPPPPPAGDVKPS